MGGSAASKKSRNAVVFDSALGSDYFPGVPGLGRDKCLSLQGALSEKDV